MNKCMVKKCKNETLEGEKYCKYHQAKMEEGIKGVVGSAVSLVGLLIFRKLKK